MKTYRVKKLLSLDFLELQDTSMKILQPGELITSDGSSVYYNGRESINYIQWLISHNLVELVE